MNKNWVITIFAMLLLAGCTGERCIEADDFGHATFNISARYSKTTDPLTGKSIDPFDGQVGANQVAPWVDSTYRINGRPLAIAIRGWDYGLDYNTSFELSAWCAWYGTSDHAHKLSRFCERLRDCEYIDGHMCTNSADAKLINAPCLFRKGVGLYALIAEKGGDPNQSLDSQRDPRGISFHVGEKPDGYSMYEVDKNGNTREAGGRVYQFESDSVKQQYADSKLYFKILDKFYDDNNGQYRVVVKSGVTRTNPDPISYVTKLVKDFLFGADGNYGLIRGIYMGIVQNPGYRSAVSAMLTLYIMFTALSYLAGHLEVTHTELIVRVGKIAIVSALLSAEYSWTFFNDYLFVYFVGGVEQILQIIVEAGATGPGSPGILALMIAPQTISKLLSLLFVDWMGFIYIILFFIALYFILMIFFQAAVIYLTALIAIGMIITMGPIFICFMLFGVTRSLFENWLKQLISSAVQPIILFTGLIFISMILRQEIYGALGFRVCKHDFPKMASTGGTPLFGEETEEALGFSMGNSLFYWWFPQPMKAEQFSKITRPIPIPLDHFSSDVDVVGSVSDTGFCEAYACIGERYVDLPFLDPVKDSRRLNQFWNGNFVQLDGMLLIFVAIYLLHKFNALTIAVAKFITGTSGNFTNLGNVGDAVRAQTFDKSNAYLASMPGRAASGAQRVATGLVDKAIGQEAREGLTAKLKGLTPSALVDKMRISALKKEALTSGANPAVLDEVRKNTGLDRSKINPEAMKEYRAALKEELLKNVDPSLPQSKREAIAQKAAAELAKRDLSALKGEFAKAKFGKEYDKLSATEKNSVDATLKDPKLRELGKKASEARRFQEAYVDAFAAMSDRGIGIVGKHNKTLRSLEEINHRVDQSKKLKQDKQRQFGQELVSEVEGVKSGLYKGLSGGKIDTMSRTFGGGAWHEINTDPDARNFTKQTYAEQLADQKSNLARSGITKTIDDYSRAEGRSVISPEFLAQATREGNSNLELYKSLERRDLNSKVHDALAGGEDPSLMGKTFMTEYAKDSEMRHMVDRAYEVEKQIHTSDEFISRQEDYQTSFDVAANRVSSAYDIAKEHYGREDITAAELPSLMQSYYAEVAPMSKEKGLAEVEKLKKSIEEFGSSQEVLQQIDKRKVEVAEEIDKHVDGINEHRKKAGMEEYHPPKVEQNVRKVRKIDDYIRNKG
jgi:type IV secretion system protein VirB6